MRNPWAITDEAAAERDRKAVAHFDATCARVVQPGMPPNVIIFKLAQLGITSWDKTIIDHARERIGGKR